MAVTFHPSGIHTFNSVISQLLPWRSKIHFPSPWIWVTLLNLLCSNAVTTVCQFWASAPWGLWPWYPPSARRKSGMDPAGENRGKAFHQRPCWTSQPPATQIHQRSQLRCLSIASCPGNRNFQPTNRFEQKINVLCCRSFMVVTQHYYDNR